MSEIFEITLDDLIKEAKKFKARKYVSNTDNFISELKKLIDN